MAFRVDGSVPSVNIIVSFSKTAIDKVIMSEMPTFDSVLEAHDSADFLLFNNLSENFLSLTHTFNFNDSEKMSNIDIEIIDPRNVFEERFINFTLDAALKDKDYYASLYSKTFEAQIQKLNDSLTTDQFLTLLENEIQLGTSTFANTKFEPPVGLSPLDNAFNAGADLLTSLNPYVFNTDNLKVANPGNSSELAKQFLDKLTDDQAIAAIDTKNRAESNELNKKVWIMYGPGQDLRDWAGPITSYLRSTSYDYSGNGSRKLILNFYANPTTFQKTKTRAYDAVGGYINATEVVYAPTISLVDTPLLFPTSNFINHLKSFKASSIHLTMKALLYSYLRQATKSANIIVLLPNLDSFTQDNYSIAKNQYLNDHENIIKKAFSPADFYADQSGATVYALKKVFNQLGCSINQLNEHGGKDLSKEANFVASELALSGAFVPATDSSKVVDSTLALNMLPTILREKLTEGAPIYKASLTSSPNEHYTDFIDDILLKIKSAVDPYPFEPVVFWEDNARTLELMAKYKLIPSALTPALIVGDEALVQRYLYALEYFTEVELLSFDFADADSPNNIKLETLLHPADKSRYPNGYMKNMYEILYTRSGAYPYGRISNLAKDQFALPPENIKKIEKLNMPIFRSGVEDSNILSMNFTVDSVYFAYLNGLYLNPSDDDRASPASVANTVNPKELDAYKGGYNQLLDAITNMQSYSPAARSKLLEFMNEALPSLQITITQKEDLAAWFTALMANTPYVDAGPSVQLDWEKGQNPFTYMMHLVKALNNYAIEGTITTLPYFHLSKSPLSLPISFVHIQEATPFLHSQEDTGEDPYNPNIAPINKFYTGFWFILGYKHRISKNNVSSSFHINKNATQTSVQQSSEVKESKSFKLNGKDVVGLKSL